MEFKTLLVVLQILISIVVYSQPSASINWDEVSDRYIEKYQPIEIPQWIFPIIFENGIGERDTIYWGYDPDANVNTQDSTYGILYTEIDSTSFQVFWDQCATCDTLTVREHIIVKEPFITFTDIRLRYGYYPVTMYYNSSLLYSDSLMPFISNTSAPNLQGEIWTLEDDSNIGNWDESIDEWVYWCPFLFPCIITDSVWFGGDIYFADSLDIAKKNNSNPAVLGVTTIAISFTEWKGGIYTNVQDLIEPEEILVFPNPVSEELNIKFNEINIEYYNWKIFDISGHIIKEGNHYKDSQINFAEIENGFYFLQIDLNHKIVTHKIIVAR